MSEVGTNIWPRTQTCTQWLHSFFLFEFWNWLNSPFVWANQVSKLVPREMCLSSSVWSEWLSERRCSLKEHWFVQPTCFLTQKILHALKYMCTCVCMCVWGEGVAYKLPVMGCYLKAFVDKCERSGLLLLRPTFYVLGDISETPKVRKDRVKVQITRTRVMFIDLYWIKQQAHKSGYTRMRWNRTRVYPIVCAWVVSGFPVLRLTALLSQSTTHARMHIHTKFVFTHAPIHAQLCNVPNVRLTTKWCCVFENFHL